MLEERAVPACHSSLFDYDDRIFLEAERFDRVGIDGRCGVVSLFAVDTARYGNLDTWTASANRLAQDGLISADDAHRIRFLDAFGALIANSDRHFGNVSFFDDYQGRFTLAPVYDMLPMLFAPQDDQLVPRQFEPSPPTAEWLSVWASARSMAEDYWDRLANESRLSSEFRAISANCLNSLRAMPQRGRAQSAAPTSAEAIG
jgi:hypothetical protein